MSLGHTNKQDYLILRPFCLVFDTCIILFLDHILEIISSKHRLMKHWKTNVTCIFFLNFYSYSKLYNKGKSLIDITASTFSDKYLRIEKIFCVALATLPARLKLNFICVLALCLIASSFTISFFHFFSLVLCLYCLSIMPCSSSHPLDLRTLWVSCMNSVVTT